MSVLSRPRVSVAPVVRADDYVPPVRFQGPSLEDERAYLEQVGHSVPVVASLGELYNHLLPFLESIGVAIEPNSVNEDGFGCRINGDLIWVELLNLDRVPAYLEPRPDVFTDEDMARIGAVG